MLLVPLTGLAWNMSGYAILFSYADVNDLYIKSDLEKMRGSERESERGEADRKTDSQGRTEGHKDSEGDRERGKERQTNRGRQAES